MSVATLTVDQLYDLAHALTNGLKALEVYLGDSNNPALVTDTDAALAAAQAETLLPTQMIITSGTKIVHAVTGSGTTGVTPTIAAGAVTALVLS